MDAFLSRLADTVDKPAKDGAVKFRPDGFKVDQAVDGVELDRATARTALRDAFLGEDTDISLQVETVSPTSTRRQCKGPSTSSRTRRCPRP